MTDYDLLLVRRYSVPILNSTTRKAIKDYSVGELDRVGGR